MCGVIYNFFCLLGAWEIRILNILDPANSSKVLMIDLRGGRRADSVKVEQRPVNELIRRAKPLC